MQAAVIGHALGVYCLTSRSPVYVHLYTAVLISLSVTVAMYCVVRISPGETRATTHLSTQLQLYMPLTKELAPCRPVLKFLAVKVRLSLLRPRNVN